MVPARGKRLLARLDADTRRLYLDARNALPGRQVFFAEAALERSASR